ncbi:MAG: hypothetical protein M1580_01975 [Candidatus Parvarchaeota archaeon]|nr:hypothetical protein [Candidatus Parvarchaeota archaeon]
MAEDLEKLLEGNMATKKGLLTKFKELYHEKIGSLRPYIASLGALSIGVANWSKDFAYNAKVVLPFLYTYFTVGGHEWYNIALAQEGLTIAGLTATANNRVKTAKYGFLYEIGSVINSVLYYTTVNTQPLGNYYGGIWNSIFYFYQVPIFFMMLKNYFGRTSKNNKSETEA